MFLSFSWKYAGFVWMKKNKSKHLKDSYASALEISDIEFFAFFIIHTMYRERERLKQWKSTFGLNKFIYAHSHTWCVYSKWWFI